MVQQVWSARCGAAAAAILAQSAQGQQPKLLDLGALGPESRAYAVSSDGGVVVGESAGQAFVWSAAAGLTALGASCATGVSRHGEVICGYSGTAGGSSMRSVRWTSWSPSGRADLNTFGDGGYSAASGISADGTVIVGNGFDGVFDTVAYRWSSGTGAATVGTSPYTGGVGVSWGAQATSADGLVVVGNTGVTSRSAFRSVAGFGSTMIVGAAESSAAALSPDGSVVVGYLRLSPGGPSLAFRWTSAGPGPAVTLPDLEGGPETAAALGVTASGATVVGWGTTAAGQEAFIWDPVGGTRSLRTALISDGETQLSGWTLTSATGISPDGKVIVGYGISPQGQVRAWRVAYECYANCDQSTASPLLNVLDFSCFLQKFGVGDAYANCDGSTAVPVLSVLDFTCFLQRYTAGCS